jgi:cation diffusion facilitator CzcD-associated flavoprotein CzcO
MAARPEHHQCVVVGAGFGGIGTSIRLAEAGIPHIVMERHDDVGGTWLANTYPGCRCDVPSHLYSFSFAPNPEWSNSYSPQQEIWQYLRSVAERYGVVDRILFGCEMRSGAWDSAAKHWVLETSHGTLTADVLIAANGPLSEPSIPEFDGMDSFRGEVLHSARWDHEIDLTGKRVAVIGTGASGVQIVPEVHRRAEHVLVFQRTAAWIMPHRGRRITDAERWLYRTVPAAQRVVRGFHYWLNELLLVPPLAKYPARTKGIRRLGLKHLKKQVTDDELRRKLTPDFLPGCKRLTPSNDYLPAIDSPRTTLVTDGIDSFTPDGIRTRDGIVYDVDVAVLATGFKVTDPSVGYRLRGRDGRTLREVWAASGGMRSYNGTTTSGFPNLFILAGPNTGIGHTSLLFMIEAQIGYVVQAVALMNARRVAALEVRPDVEALWDEDVQRKLARSVWNTGGCSSWYLDERGRNPSIWPDFTFAYAKRLSRFDLESYYQELRPAPVPDGATAASNLVAAR